MLCSQMTRVYRWEGLCMYGLSARRNLICDKLLAAVRTLLVITLSGLAFQSAATAQSNVQGQWRTLSTQMPINPVHVALMHNGQVLIVSGSGNLPSDTTYLGAIWNPATDTVTTQSVPWDMFCNGMIVLPDGRPFIISGTIQYDPFEGDPRTAAYDPATGNFVQLQSMAHGRWYPTATTLGDGSVMVFSGLDENGNTNTTVEIYKVGSGWSQPYEAGWTPPLYPRMHLLPNGTVFYSGSTTSSAIFNPTTQTWTTNVANTNYSGTRTYGTSVLLPLTPANNYDPRVMIMGGGNPATNTTEIIDLGASNPKWVYGPSMSQPRIEMDAVILPNGKILAVNGSTNDEDATTASLNADLYDPVSNTFSSAGANAYPRLYHSGALLLPDATVLVLGSNPARGTYEPHMELYSPAYLFNSDGSLATRPTITSVTPGVIGYGNSFQIQTPNAASISSAILVRAGSPTHSFDMDQRLVGLSFTAGNGVLNATAPPNGNIAPPGYYLLFILNSSGVPSLAQFVQISATPNDQPPHGTITSPTNNPTIAPGQSVTFSGTGTSSGSSIAAYSWVFPGGSPSTSSLANPGAVIYANAGTYTASLTVTDALGVSDPNPPTQTITVSNTAQPDFSLSPSPTSQTVFPGSNASFNVIVTPAGQFNGTVTFGVSGLPAGATASFNPASVNGSGTSTLSVTTSSSTPLGTSTLTITGTSGSLSHNTSVALTVSTSASTSNSIGIDFVGMGTPMGSAEVAGVVPESNWNNANGAKSSSPLALVDSTGAATAATVSWTSDDVWDESITDAPGNVRMMKGYLDNGQTDTSTVTVSGLPSSSGGYTVYVYADGSTSGTNTGIYQISGAGITTTSINLTYNSNFTGTFTQANNSVGNYVVFTIANVSGFTLQAIPSTASSGYERAPLNGIQIVPQAGSPSPDFTLTATAVTSSVAPGGTATYTVNIGALNGFSGSVNLSVSGVPSGATGSFNPTAVSGSGSSTLSIATTGSTATGSDTLTITGTSGSLSHSATVPLTVTGSVSGANPIGIDFVGMGTSMGSAEVAGVVPESNWNNANGAKSSSALALVDSTGAATAATVSWTSDDVWDESITDAPGNVRMMKGYLDNGQTDTSTVTVSGLPSSSGGYTVYVYADGSTSGTNTGIYQISGAGITTTSINLTYNSNFTGTFTQANNSVGNYVVFTIANVSGFTLQAIPSTASSGYERAPLNGIQIVPQAGSPSPDFTLTATAVTSSVAPGGTATYTVNIGALNGFSGSVNLSVSGVPSGATGSFNPTAVSGSGSSTLSIATTGSTATGSDTLTITGTSGSLSHSATAPLTVAASPDFTLTATAVTSSVAPGGTATYTVNIGALNGFSGSVNLSVSGVPSGATGSFNPTAVSGSGSSTLSIATTGSTATGSDTLTITGTSGSLSHSATVPLTVTGSVSGANPIGIDFVGMGTSMGSAEVAGVVPESNWNNANGAKSSSALALVDGTGAATAATVSWTSDDVWDESITDAPGNVRMMKGYLDNGQTDTSTVTVSGLPSSSGGYTVYVYADGSTSGTNTGIYQISGAGITTTSINLTYNSNFTGTFTQANNSVGNYVVFTIANVSGFTLQAIPSTASSGYERAPLNGIQIVPQAGSPSPDFTLTATAVTSSVAPGGTATYTVNIGALNGFSGSVNLSVSGVPSGATGSFNPTAVSGSGSSTLSIATTGSTATGSDTLTITGTSGSLSHSATVPLTVTGSVSGANPIGIDFVGMGTSMGSAEVAGVVPESNWNNANGAKSSSALALVDSTGAATAATVSWTSDDVWDESITDAPGNVRMMKGYLDNGQTDTSTVTVSGLPSSSGGYTVYVYADGSTSGTNTGIYQISGAGITTTSINLTYNSNFTGTFTQANNSVGNYVVFTIANVSGFTLQAIPSTASSGYERAPLNGIQIVPN